MREVRKPRGNYTVKKKKKKSSKTKGYGQKIHQNRILLRSKCSVEVIMIVLDFTHEGQHHVWKWGQRPIWWAFSNAPRKSFQNITTNLGWWPFLCSYNYLLKLPGRWGSILLVWHTLMIKTGLHNPNINCRLVAFASSLKPGGNLSAYMLVTWSCTTYQIISSNWSAYGHVLQIKYIK